MYITYRMFVLINWRQAGDTGIQYYSNACVVVFVFMKIKKNLKN